MSHSTVLRRTAFNLLKFLVSGLLLYVVFRNFDFSQMRWPSSLQDFLYYGVAFTLLALVISMDGIRLYLLLPKDRAVKSKGDLMHVIRAHIAAYGFAVYSPSVVIAEAYKAAVLGKVSGGYDISATMIVLNRIIGLSVVLSMFIAGGFLMDLPGKVSFSVPWSASVFVAAGIFFCAILVYLFRTHHYIDKIKALASNVTGAVLQTSPLTILTVTFLSVSMECIRTVSLLLCMLALGLPLDFLAALVASVVGTLSFIVPLTIGGLGVREAGSSQVFVWAGYQQNEVLAAVLLFRILMMGLGLIGLVLFVFRRKEKRSE